MGMVCFACALRVISTLDEKPMLRSTRIETRSAEGDEADRKWLRPLLAITVAVTALVAASLLAGCTAFGHAVGSSIDETAAPEKQN